MLLLRWLLVAPVSLLLFACNREAPVALQAPQTKPETNGGSVWVVDAPATGGRLFLCGTIHILRQQDYPLPAAYDAAYDHSTKLVLELPPGAGAGGELSKRMAELGTYPEGHSLQATVGQKTFSRVEAWATRRKVSPATLDRYHPWFVALIISATEYGALGAKPDIGVDQAFEQRAARDGKSGEGLETVEFQLKLFTQLDPKQQHDLLDQTLDEVATLPNEYEKMITAWRAGDLDVLGEMLFREAERFPDLMDLFLISRNKTWMTRLEEILRKGEKAMVLVGAGHLASDQGLIALLKERGYQVRHWSESTGL